MSDGQNSSLGNTARALDDELVPLAVAAQVAYFDLMRANAACQDESALAEVTRLTAIALAQIAPIYGSAQGGGPRRLSEREIEQLLFRSVRDGGGQRLDDVHIRRADFRTALATLKDARSLFGAP